jgi:hypothetical protein
MRDAEACWIPSIGRIDNFRTSMDSGRTHLWRARQKNSLPLFFLAAGCGVYRGYTKMGGHPSSTLLMQ